MVVTFRPRRSRFENPNMSGFAAVTHENIADEATGEQEAENWLKAAMLGPKAKSTCKNAESKARSRGAADRCDAEIDIDVEFEGQAEQTLGIPTLAELGLDRLDFH